jgi:REP element-mobilizing transposase RayT
VAHAFNSIHIHIIFSTKNREPMISAQLKPRLMAYMGGILHGIGAVPLIINGVEDHVHVLSSLPPVLALSNLIRDLKANSSGWVNEQFGQPFGWQTGYAAFSVSKSLVEAARGYIETQEIHHQRVSFRDEYLLFLKRHGITYDERFVLEGEYVA